MSGCIDKLSHRSYACFNLAKFVFLQETLSGQLDHGPFADRRFSVYISPTTNDYGDIVFTRF